MELLLLAVNHYYKIISEENEKFQTDATGLLLKERYKIKEVLDKSRGGEADIYLADDLVSKTVVIIKLYREGLNPKVKILEKLITLEHPNLLKTLDFGEINKQIYEVQEFAEGGSLETQIPFEEKNVKSIIIAMNEALNYLHKKHIVHRDIKPSNMLYFDKKNNEKITTINQLIQNMRSNYDLSIKLLKRGTISSFIRSNTTFDGFQDIANDIDDYIEEINDHEELYFKSIYKLQ